MWASGAQEEVALEGAGVCGEPVEAKAGQQRLQQELGVGGARWPHDGVEPGSGGLSKEIPKNPATPDHLEYHPDARALLR